MEQRQALIQDVIEWDVENWSRALRFWDANVDLTSRPLQCLELGARRGGIALWLARQGHSVVCSDLEDNRDVASPLHQRYGLQGRITYQAIDATAIPYHESFDIVAFKSLLGGVGWDGNINRQAAAVQSMYRALKPGGALLFAENLRGSAMHRFFRRRFVKWNTIWRYVSLDEMLEFLAPFAEVRFDTTGVFGLFGRNAALSSALGKIDGALFDRIVAPRSRYIVFGVAKK